MSVNVTSSSFQAWYKNRYGKKNDTLPLTAKIQKLIPFQERARTGRAYVEPVLLSSAHGLTIKGGTARGTVYAYNDPQSPVMDEVEISGCEITLRDQIAVGAIAAAVGGDASYGPIVDYQVMELMKAHRSYIEIFMLYGQSTIGVVSGTPSTSGSNKVVTITSASWAPGIWARGEKMRLDFYSALGGTQRTDAQTAVVESIDFDNRQITVSGDSGDLGDIADGDVIVVRDAEGATGTFTGIDKVITNTGSLHGIDASSASRWKGNVKTVSSVPLTMGVLHSATTKAVDRGLSGEITWLVPTASWQNLADNESALRRYADATGKEYKTGAEKLTFFGSNGGAMSIEPHSGVKWGEAFGIVASDWVRGGESDLTDTLPGAPDDVFFHQVQGYSAVEILNFSSQFLFCRVPSNQVKITGLLPTGI